MYLNSSMVQIPDVECFKSKKYPDAKNIAKYFGKEVRCVLCESQRQSELSVINTGSTCAEMPASTSLRLFRLGYVQPPENIQVPLSKRTESVETKILMRFMECINLEGGGPSVVEFDVEVFQPVLRFAARDDHLVNNWISMVLSDKAEYKEGTSFFALLLLVYDFLKRYNLPQLRELKEKIISSERFFKPHRICDISWQDDAEIDKFVIQMIKPRVDQTYAYVLNKMLVSLSVNCEQRGRRKSEAQGLFTVFHTYLIEILKAATSDVLFSLLSIIFVSHTVLFKYMTETSLYKVIAAFYEKHSKGNLLLSLLEVLSVKVMHPSANEYLCTKYLSMASQVYKAKLPKAFFVISISLFKTFEEYTSYFERYKNKHIAIKTGLEELSKIDIPECQVDILMVILNLFDLLSIHEMGGYFHDICRILSLSLVKIDPLSPAFRAFAEIHWKRMSKVVLSLQRVSASEVKVKKKKLDSLSVSGSSKAVLKILQLARSIEEKAGIADDRIKMRGFAMK